MRLTSISAAIAAIALAGAIPAAALTAVAGNQNTLTSLGSYSAGSYLITASGLVDLSGRLPSGFTVRPDGVPDVPVTVPGYGYFNPNGSPFDIPAGNAVGPAGATINLGALIGTFTATPSSPSDYFLIGYGTSLLTLATAGNIYAQVNDTFYPNNGGFFLVDVQPVGGVPEPMSWALMIVGFAMTGSAMRRRCPAASFAR